MPYQVRRAYGMDKLVTQSPPRFDLSAEALGAIRTNAKS